jgi:hypothetical protein
MLITAALLPTTDDDIVRGFEDGSLPPSRFRHREHVLVAWTYLASLPFETASARFLDHLRRYVDLQGASSKFDEALTRAYLETIAARIRATPPMPTFDAFVRAHPDLLTVRVPPCRSA